MVDPQTVNVLLSVPTRGSNVGVWDTPVNGDFVAIDGLFGGVQNVALSSSNVTLTSPTGSPTPGGGPTQSQNGVVRFTGTLSANIVVTLPLPGFIIIENLTTYSATFVIQLRAVGVGQVIGLPTGTALHVYNDGTNVRFVNLPMIGTYMDVYALGIPRWMLFCDVSPYLLCDGSVFSGATYPFLAAFLGTTTLPDFRGVFPAFNNSGTGKITTAGSGVDGNTNGATGGSQNNALITANLPAYTPAGSVSGTFAGQTSDNLLKNGNLAQNLGSGTSGYGWSNVPTVGTSVVTGTITGTLTGTAQGGTSSPFTNIPPATIGGVRLIRAG